MVRYNDFDMLPRRPISCRHETGFTLRDCFTLRDGFTLIEALVGLTLIGIVMLLTMSLLAIQPGIERRIASHRDALQSLEMELEQIRSTLVLPEDGELDISELPRPSPAAAEALQIFVDVKSMPGRNLYQVKLTALYFVGERPYEQVLESMVFAP